MEEYKITDETLLQIEGINKSFTDSSNGQVNTVLKGVDQKIFDIVRPGVSQGQVVSILGPSGIGKTTLFEIIAGIEKPDSGQVMVRNPLRMASADDKVPLLVPVNPGMVGVVYQSYPTFEYLKVHENLMRGAKLGGIRGKEAIEKVKYYLEHLGLLESRNKFPAQLSGGQRQRLAIGQQLLCSSVILLMDEPFSGLDPNAKNDVMRLIVDLSKTNELITFIVVTHDIQSAVAISDTVWIMGKNPNDVGASIIESYNLIEMGLAWHPEIKKMPEYHKFIGEIEENFPRYAGK
ncbi:ATP-binding cassette domain-containing protein [Candidatus Nomurabacteria bacterium]|nr:MAG: ATP-binding cassette domain-containing protein [Candidatus Nomurabacteria bacterium]